VTSQKQKHHHNKHLPVLLEPTIRLLKPKMGESYLDLTAGYGGHASAVLRKTKNALGMMLVDRDMEALGSLENFKKAGATLVHSDFASAASRLAGQNKRFDMILLDLGVSSPQLDNPARGFSIYGDAPLDMRMDATRRLSARDIVNKTSEKELADILRKYGQERRAATIAKAIVKSRPIETTGRLAEIVKKTQPFRSKRHPATRTFQAIRIAVNEELDQLEKTLPLLPDLLKEGGRLAIISFHSLEDRLVKNFLKEEAAGGYEARLKLINKKPISGQNDASNPRARSAKLRGAVKIKTKTERS